MPQAKWPYFVLIPLLFAGSLPFLAMLGFRVATTHVEALRWWASILS
jgi:hypothetical protein